MGYTIKKLNDDRCFFYCDSVSDLPDTEATLINSEAFVLDSNSTFILNTKREWILKGDRPFNSPLKIANYLYKINYDNWCYDDGIDFFTSDKDVDMGGCASLTPNKWLVRNYDWKYDNNAEFVLYMKANNGKFASIGIANGGLNGKAGLSNQIAEYGVYNDIYKVLPFKTCDGINENGVAVSVNVVPNDKGKTIDTNPGKERMSLIMLPRFILDYAESADDAIDKIKNDISWFAPKSTEMHFLIKDATKSFIVEFINNEIKVYGDGQETLPYDDSLSLITNFHLTDWDGTIITGFDEPEGIDPDITTLEPHAAGLERYAILKDFDWDGVTSAKDIGQAMKDVWFTKAYVKDNKWYSEILGGEYTVYSGYNQLDPVLNAWALDFNSRSRDKGDTWQTVHTSIYDIQNKKLYVYSQERDRMYEFEFPTE